MHVEHHRVCYGDYTFRGRTKRGMAQFVPNLIKNDECFKWPLHIITVVTHSPSDRNNSSDTAKTRPRPRTPSAKWKVLLLHCFSRAGWLAVRRLLPSIDGQCGNWKARPNERPLLATYIGTYILSYVNRRCDLQNEPSPQWVDVRDGCWRCGDQQNGHGK